MRAWILIVTLMGCAGVTTVDEARVARLPVNERAELVSRTQRVTIAESNVATTRVAMGEAKQLRATASPAQHAYADRLIALREAQLAEADATLELTRADLEWTKLQALRRHHLDAGIDPRPLVARHEAAQTALASARQRVARLTAEAEQLRASLGPSAD